MKAERARILDMLHQGAISVEQAEQLLDALEKSFQKEAPSQPEPQPAALSSEARGVMGGGLGGSIASTVANALRGVFGGLGGGGRANFSAARLTKEGLARMAEGTSYTNFGQLTIADDVPEELLRQKIGSLTNFGHIAGPANLVSVIEAVCDTNFGSIGTDGDEMNASPGLGLVNQGKTVVTRQQLEHMADNSKLVNQGKLTVAEDVPVELLAQKIGSYTNQGKTYGPAALLGVLQARCSQNQGKFVPTTDGEEEEDED
jgi:hypothetical protein